MASFLNQHKVRGLRNNNPGNLVKTNIAWQGKIPQNQNPDKNFEQFTTLEHGIRAMLKDLINDINKGKNTVRKLISEYAPAFENNTVGYINSVAKTLKVLPDETLTKINASFLLLLARAILKVELGSAHVEVKDSHIKTAISMLGDVSTNNLKVDTKVTKVIPFILSGLLVFFYTYITLTL